MLYTVLDEKQLRSRSRLRWLLKADYPDFGANLIVKLDSDIDRLGLPISINPCRAQRLENFSRVAPSPSVKPGELV
jgi:hypothetical protein